MRRSRSRSTITRGPAGVLVGVLLALASLGYGINQGAGAFGLGHRVDVHVDRTEDHYHARTSRHGSYVSYTAAGHYTEDGVEHPAELDGDYPVGTTVTAYLPLLGTDPVVHGDGWVTARALGSLLVGLPLGLLLAVASVRHLRRDRADRLAAFAPRPPSGSWPPADQPEPPGRTGEPWPPVPPGAG